MQNRLTLFTTVMASLGLLLGSNAWAVKFGSEDIPVRQIASLPLADSDGRIAVDQNAVLAFPKPPGWSAAEFAGAAVQLTGPEGQVKVAIQPLTAQDAVLIKPETVLAPGVDYVLRAVVKGRSQELHLLVNGRKGGSGPSGVLTPDLGRWIPNLGQKRDDWYSNLPDHSLPNDQLLQAPAGVTALSGQVRLIRDAPLVGAKLSLGETTVTTDQQGRFLLERVSAGSQTLTLEAEGYGTYQAHVNLEPGRTTALPYTMWASRLATEHKIILDSPTKADVVIRNPEMPGFELRVPKGTVIKDRQGKVVNELTITPLPVDRSPFPLPKFNIPTYFTIQPGAARLYAADGKTPKGAQLVYPNYQHLQPGEGGEFWNYDPRDKGWYTYGRGRVSADGQQVVPNEGVLIYELTGAMFLNPTPSPPGPPLSPPLGDPPPADDPNDNNPPKPPLPTPVQGDADNGSPQSNRGDDCTAADPIDCSSGNFVWNQTDLALKDRMPVALGRSYIQEDDTPRAFGKGWASNLDVYISSLTTTCCSGYGEADLILPSGERVHYIRSSPGTGYSDAELVHVGSQSAFYKTKLKEVSSAWILTLRDGSTMTMPWATAMTSMTDRNGNTLTVTRDGQLPTRITGPTGRYINITLDSANRISTATDDQGRSVTYAYDADGYLTTVTYPDSTTDQYSYVSFTDSPYKILASHRDRRGVLRMTTQFGRYVGRYYTQFQCNGTATPGTPCDLTRIATANGPTSGPANSSTTPTSSAGPTAIQVFDCVTYKPSKQIYPDGGFYAFKWTLDNYCRVMNVSITDPRGIKTLREFNIDGHLIKETVAVGTPLQRVTQLITRTTEYPRYSARGGKPPTTVIPSDPTNDPGSNFRRSVTDSAGRTTTFKYDSNGNVTEAAGPRGITRATYNSLSQPLTVTNELSQTNTFTYDTKGNLLTVTDALGRTSSFTYSSAGQLLSLTDPLGRATSYQYSGANLTSVTYPLNRTVNYTYDGNGRVLSMSDPAGRITRYQYNVNDQMVKVTDAAGQATTMQYDNAGNLLKLTDPLSRQYQWNYDWASRVTSQIDPLNQTETYGYDLNGNPTSYVDRKNQTSTSAYDALDRLTSTTDPVGSIAYGYDSRDRITSLNEGSRTLSYAYDNLNQLTSETTPEGTVGYTYDTLGKRTGLTVNGTNGITYTYDNGNRLTGITRGSQSVLFTYDNADRVTSVLLPNGVTQQYAYDAGDQLTEIQYKKGATLLGNLTYQYDTVGRRTGMGGSYARTLLPAAIPSANYDSNNRLTAWNAKTLTYDANGNLTGDGTYSYTWNARDQLTQVKQGATILGQYAYDATGRRTTRTLGTTTTKYLYDGISAIRESVGIANTDLLGLGLDNYFTRTDASGTKTYLKDALGSTLALSDGTGAVQTTYTYGPYGQTSQTGAASSNSNAYTGREMDAGNLYYYRARYYSPEFSRFISQDQIGLGGGINWNAYVGGNPISNADPTGNYFGWDDAAVALGGAVIGGVSQVLGDIATGQPVTWQNVAGSAIGGAAGAVTTLYLGPIAGGVVAGGLGNFSRQINNTASGNQSAIDWGSLAFDTAVGGLTNGIASRVTQTFVGSNQVAGSLGNLLNGNGVRLPGVALKTWATKELTKDTLGMTSTNAGLFTIGSGTLASELSNIFGLRNSTSVKAGSGCP